MGKFGWSYPPGCSGGPYDNAPEPSELEDAVLGLLEEAGIDTETNDKIMRLIADAERAKWLREECEKKFHFWTYERPHGVHHTKFKERDAAPKVTEWAYAPIENGVIKVGAAISKFGSRAEAEAHAIAHNAAEW